jgi:hypothetical protein
MKDLNKIVQGLPITDIDNLVKLSKSPFYDYILKFNGNIIFQTSLLLAEKANVSDISDVRYYQGYIAGVNELVNNLEYFVETIRTKQEDDLGDAIIQPLNVAEKFSTKLRKIFDKNIKLLLRLGKQQ